MHLRLNAASMLFLSVTVSPLLSIHGENMRDYTLGCDHPLAGVERHAASRAQGVFSVRGLLLSALRVESARLEVEAAHALASLRILSQQQPSGQMSRSNQSDEQIGG